MGVERQIMPAKRGWMNAISVIDPAERRLAANDNVSRAMRVLRWDRRLRAARRIGLGILCLFFGGVGVLAMGQNDQADRVWALVFDVGAIVALWGVFEK